MFTKYIKTNKTKQSKQLFQLCLMNTHNLSLFIFLSLLSLQTVDHLRRHGLTSEGIFRRSANAIEAKAAKQQYNDGMGGNVKEEQGYNRNVFVLFFFSVASRRGASLL